MLAPWLVGPTGLVKVIDYPRQATLETCAVFRLERFREAQQESLDRGSRFSFPKPVFLGPSLRSTSREVRRNRAKAGKDENTVDNKS